MGSTVRINEGTSYEDVAKWSADEIEFLRAVEEYRRTRNRPFPTLREILAVLRSLGYLKVAPREPLPRPRPYTNRRKRKEME